ncbi:5230_t:CDS:2, partial [Dentiscutata heterogama]
EETNATDDDYSTLIIKVDDDEDDESKNKSKENTIQQLAKLKENEAVDLKKLKILNKALLQVLKNKIGDCIDNKKRIADQQVLINYLEEQIKIVKSSNSNKEKINVNLIEIIRKIKKEQS